jgi:hypothetical protein
MKKLLFILALGTFAMACGPSSNQGKKGSGDSAVKGGADTGPDTLQRQSSTDTITNK